MKFYTISDIAAGRGISRQAIWQTVNKLNLGIKKNGVLIFTEEMKEILSRDIGGKISAESLKDLCKADVPIIYTISEAAEEFGVDRSAVFRVAEKHDLGAHVGPNESTIIIFTEEEMEQLRRVYAD